MKNFLPAVLCLGALLLVVGSGKAADRRTSTDRLSIMTFNAEFLWDGREPEDGKPEVLRNVAWAHRPDLADAHMEKVATVIRRHSPDIVNLVEVEGREALNYFNNRFLSGLGYRPYFVQGKDTQTGEDVCLLTRIDPISFGRDDRMGQAQGTVQTISKGVSKNYVALFNTSPQKFALIGVHLLARPTDLTRKPAREAQADAVRAMSEQVASLGYAPIVLGDFNDYDGDPTCLDRVWSFPVSNVLLNIKSRNRAILTDDLFNVCQLVPQRYRYTSSFGTNRVSSIDHILVAPEMKRYFSQAYIPHDYAPGSVSDHWPIVAKFNFAP